MKNTYIDKNGMDVRTGLYISRYYAHKAAMGDKIIIKVEGGYKIMSAANYNIWRGQR